MAFSELNCIQCGKNQVRRKRRSAVRYRLCKNMFGAIVGEYRYYAVICHGCHIDGYVEERHPYGKQEETRTKRRYVSERAYQTGSIHPPGTERIGNTAGEYTRRVSAGADRFTHHIYHYS